MDAVKISEVSSGAVRQNDDTFGDNLLEGVSMRNDSNESFAKCDIMRVISVIAVIGLIFPNI